MRDFSSSAAALKRPKVLYPSKQKTFVITSLTPKGLEPKKKGRKGEIFVGAMCYYSHIVSPSEFAHSESYPVPSGIQGFNAHRFNYGIPYRNRSRAQASGLLYAPTNARKT